MYSVADLPSTIPVFPLPGAMLLPRARLPLHIFEPRYLTMLDDVLKTSQRLIGMVQPLGDDADLHSVGCAGRISAFSETEDGRYMITLAGVSRFQISAEIESFAPYRRCDVGWDGFARDLGAAEHDQDLDRPGFLGLLKRYFDAEELNVDWDALGDAEDELLLNSMAMLCPFSPEDKQALLEAPCLTSRRETLVTLLEYALRRGSRQEVMQ